MTDKIFLSMNGLNKVYPNGVHAVHDFTLQVKEKEFIVLVGPSGCGKSTTLRMIAGLEEITSGLFYLNERIANNLSPKDRDVAMVFQSYALYPHMSVFNNLAFGLRMRRYKEELKDKKGQTLKGIDKKAITKIDKVIKHLEKDCKRAHIYLDKTSKITDEIEREQSKYEIEEFLNFTKTQIAKKEAERQYYQTTEVPLFKFRPYRKDELITKVNKAAEVLDITKYLFSRPRELSGGQRQRVALGRTIVRNSKLFLMDEPLSNLDAKLRISMRSEIVALHRALEATTIYVTHDQIEAMTMADRIVIMRDGYIEQIGAPFEIYNYPINVFVASFIGSPAMNIFETSYVKNELILNKSKILIDFDLVNKHRECINDEIKKLSAEIEEDNKNVEYYRALISATTNPFKKNVYVAKEAKIVEELKAKEEKLSLYKESKALNETPILCGVRPENIMVSKSATPQSFLATITFVELLGKEYYLHLNINDQKIIVSTSAKQQFEVGEQVSVSFDQENLHFFDTVSQKAIR